MDFAGSRVADQTALSAIEAVAQSYQDLGKEVHLRHLAPDCRRVLSRSGLIVEVAEDDPEYGVAADYSVRTGLFGDGH